MNELVGGLGYAVKNWWMSLLLGLLYIAVALCLLFAPVSSYVALSVILQYLDSGQWHSGSLFCCRKQKNNQ
jgi:hypothetical protein